MFQKNAEFVLVKQMKIYLDNGATTSVAKEAVKAMLPYFAEKYGNPSSLHSFGNEAKIALDNSRAAIAKKLNCLPEEIIFTASGSEANNLAIKGTAFANKKKGSHIITTKIEHPCVLGTCNYLFIKGFKITYLDVDKEGLVNLDQLRKEITDKTVLISIMHANNEIGTIQPIEEAAKIAKEKGILFHTDAVQSFTKVPIDLGKLKNIDLLSMSSHKIHGPKGVGALFVRKGVKLEKQIHGGKHEFDLRAGTENVPGIVGFAKASEIIKKEDIERMIKLRDRLITGLLKKIPDCQLNGSREKRLCNNANIAFNFIEGESILLELDSRGIAVSTGSACSTHSLKPSHVLMALGLKHEVAHGSIRFTLSKYTTQEEIDYVIEETAKAVERLRKISPLVKG